MTIDSITTNAFLGLLKPSELHHKLIPSHPNQTKQTPAIEMQSNQNMSFASAISGNAFNPIIISDDDDLGELAYAQTPFFSGFGKTGNSSNDGSSTTSSTTSSTSTSFSSPPTASSNMMQHPRNMSFDTSTITGYAHNPIIIIDDEDDDDYDVRLFLSVFAGTKEPSGLAAQESMVRELVREMMGRD
jgi:hypothetical protein